MNGADRWVDTFFSFPSIEGRKGGGSGRLKGSRRRRGKEKEGRKEMRREGKKKGDGEKREPGIISIHSSYRGRNYPALSRSVCPGWGFAVVINPCACLHRQHE